MTKSLANLEYFDGFEDTQSQINQRLEKIGGATLELCGRSIQRASRILRAVRGDSPFYKPRVMDASIQAPRPITMEDDEVFLGDADEPQPEYTEAA